MPYQQERSAVEFTAPLSIREDGYWEDHMLPYLESEDGKLLLLTVPGQKPH